MNKVTPIRPIVHTCSCGKTYDRVTWKKLVFVGVQIDDGKAVELRNCAVCQSTRAREIVADLAVLVVLLNETARRLNDASQKLIDHPGTAPEIRASERERCARIADDFAREHREKAKMYSEFPAMAAHREQMAIIAERVAYRIRRMIRDDTTR